MSYSNKQITSKTQLWNNLKAILQLPRGQRQSSYQRCSLWSHRNNDLCLQGERDWGKMEKYPTLSTAQIAPACIAVFCPGHLQEIFPEETEAGNSPRHKWSALGKPQQLL